MAKSLSKVIRGDSAGDKNVQQWHPPSMGLPMAGKVGSSERPGSMLTAEQLEQLQKAAYEEGFEQGKRAGFEYGHKEGLGQARSQAKQLTAAFEALLQTLDKPLEKLDEQMEQELIGLVISMVRQLIRREIRTDPGHIIGVVREALAILPVSSRNISLLLHPEDGEMVREIYDLSEGELGWKIVEDPVLSRGGCRILTETSQVDATLEARLEALIAPLLGDQREQEGGA